MVRRAQPADAAAVARVHVASWQTTYAGLLPDSYLAGLRVDDYTARWARVLEDPSGRNVVLVAEEHGQVVGYASCGPERDGDPRYAGELYAIYLLREAQRGGRGRELVRAAAEALSARGITSMVVWVLRDNTGARAFYERLGGGYLREREMSLGWDTTLTVTEAGYLWADTAATLLRDRRR